MATEEARKEESQKAVLAAYLSLSMRGKDITPENLVRESLQVSSMVSERGLAMRVMNSVRIRAVVESITFEQTSQRFVVAYRPVDKPGERKEIRETDGKNPVSGSSKQENRRFSSDSGRNGSAAG